MLKIVTRLRQQFFIDNRSEVNRVENARTSSRITIRPRLDTDVSMNRVIESIIFASQRHRLFPFKYGCFKRILVFSLNRLQILFYAANETLHVEYH